MHRQVQKWSLPTECQGPHQIRSKPTPPAHTPPITSMGTTHKAMRAATHTLVTQDLPTEKEMDSHSPKPKEAKHLDDAPFMGPGQTLRLDI